MKKRIISLFLALALCVGMLPAPAWAEEPTDPTQAVEVVGAANPSEETDPTTEPTEEETEPTEGETEPTEEETEPTEETTDPTDGLQDQTIPEEAAAFATLPSSYTLHDGVSTDTLTLEQDTTLVLAGDYKIQCKKPLNLNGFQLTIQGTGSLELVGSNNDGSYYNSGAIYDSTWTGTGYTGGGMVIESGTVIARDDVYNAVAVRYLHMTGGKLEAYGARAGIVTTELQMTDGSLYATGNSKCGINMYSAPYAVSVNGLNILVSNEPNAQDANMEDGTTKQIENSEPMTVAIGKFSTSPSISVQPQKGYLYEATAKSATFALSGRNVDLSALTLEWTGTYTGLTASADGKTLTVTTDKTVQAGTYGLKVSAGGASRTAVVTVSGPPICIYDRPVDTISTDPEAGAVTVSAYLTDGHSGSIAFQWKLADGTVMKGYTDEIVPLIDLVELGMLTQDESKPWLQTIRIYCTLSYDGYSLDTDTVTVGLNSCKHPKVDHEGNCTQCGQKRGSNEDVLIVREDGLYHLIADVNQSDAQVGVFMYSGGNFYLTGDVKNRTVNVSDTNGGGKNVTLDLQGHTVKNLQMGNFPYGTFTVKNGTLGEIRTSASGKLILEDIRYQGKWFDDQFELTVQGENTRFERPVTFWGTTHLKGGHFEQGLDSNCADRALELLEDGFAFYDNDNKVVDATDSAKLVGKQIHVASHICSYRYGKCACGRSCDHQGTTDENGYCTNCGTFVYPFAIGEKLYTDLKAALTAAQEGDTVTLRGDYDMQGAAVEITKSITLELNGHTLSSWPYAPILTILAPDVTIQNGTVKNTSTSKSSRAVEVGSLSTTGATLTVKDASFEGSESNGTPRNDGLSIFAGNTAQVENGTFTGGISVNGSLTLSGGKADHIYVGTGVTYASLLAKGYAYQVNGQLVKPEDMADGIAVEVVKCGHPDGLTGTEPCAYCGLKCDHPGMDSTTGNCTVCGCPLATASVAAGGTTTYFADFSAALDAAKAASGSTLTLLRDVTLTGENNLYIASGTFTVDWNGHTLSGKTRNNLLVITYKANVTLKDSLGNGGLRNVGGRAIGAFVGSEGSLTIQGGVYSPQLWKDGSAYGPIRISGGRFENPEDSGMNGALYCDSGVLADLLAQGYTFAYVDDDSLFDVYHQNQSDIYRSVYVVEHQHEFGEDGKCDHCGYVCPHARVDEEGFCTDCGKRFYVRGTYDDGTIHYYGTLSDALEDPAVTQAVIIGTLSEECESWNGGDRSVTLDLHGFGAVIKSVRSGHLTLRDSTESGSILEMKEIQKDGQVSVESGTVFPKWENLSVNVYGKLTVTGGDMGSLTAMEGSTVSLSGGRFGKIAGSGVTLRSLLAENYYYAELNGETPKNYADTDTVIEGVSVKLCDHTSVRKINAAYGWPQYKCNCGKVTYLLTVTVGESDKKYFGDYNTGFDYAAKNDGVVRFLKLPDGTIEVNAQGMVTIDMENRSYRAGDRSLVIKSGSTVKLVGQGAVMSKPETGGGSGSSGTREYGEFIPVTVESGGTFVLPANNLNGEPNMAKPTQLTVQSGGTAELQGGSTHWTDVYGTLKISGGSHSDIHQYEKGQLNITDGQITRLEIHGDIPQNALSGGSYVTISVWEFQFGESEKLRDVTFADFQKMLVSGKVFQKKQDQSYPNEVEETPNYGTFNYKKELNKVNVTAAPFTGVQVVCQLGTDTYEEKVSTQYNVGEMDSSGNVVFRLGVRLQPQEVQSGVTVQWYQLGAEDSRTPVGTGLTCPLDPELPVGTHRFLAVVNCSGYVLESQPFAVTITPRVVNITGGFTAQERDYEPDNPSVQIIRGEVTFDKKAEGDDLGAQVHGGTVATPDAGQNRTVAYSATLTGEDKDNYILGSVPDLTVTIRPIAQTLAFAEAAVTKTYGDSPFVNALDHSAGDGQITYTSSDPAVATVGTDGTVTIRGAGEARITATAAATQNYVETATSFDLTVAKATGTVRNRNYSRGYLYGDDIPTPERKYFEASSTGAFRYSWSPAAPKNAGNYQLTVTVDEDGNYTSATLVLDVLVEKDVWVRPTLVKAENETVDGKKDGKVTYTGTPALEYRLKRTRGEWIPVAVPAGEESVTVEGLAPETYEFRRPGDENHFASSPETITIQPGPKLTVTLPSPQTGYTLTADKVELSWHDSVTLTLTVAEGYYKTASLAVKAGDRVFTEDNGTYTLTNVEENLVITLEGVEKDEKAPWLALQNWTFGKGALQGIASPKDWKNISTATAPYYVISTRGNYFAVEAWDGETGLASVSYLLSRTALTREALEQAAWEPVPEESLNLASPDREKMIQLGLGEWYFYVKAVDKAGNVSYVGSNKLIREEKAPTFSGVTNGATYYTTQKVTITDDYALSRYLPPLSRYWKDIGGTSYEVTLEGNREGTYTLKAEDACQNTATLTVTMKPISALTEDIRDLTEDNVRKSDLGKLNQAEKALKALDTTNATDAEKKEIAGALDNIGKLKTVLEEVTQVEAMIAALPERVEPWDAETEKRVLDTRSAYDVMTDHQKTMVDDSKLRTLEGQLVDYRFTSGENQTWALGCGKELRFTVNGQLAKVKEVRLNGQAVDTEKTAQAKGTDFALKAADLQGLKPGSYTLQVCFTDGQTPLTQVTVTVSPNYLDLSGYPDFDNEENVTVNGRTYPIGTDGGRYVNLPETGDILQCFTYLGGTYSAAHENYPTGMTAYRILRQEGGAKLERIDGLDDLLIYSGCSIRISGKQGIRMITGITQDNKKALTGKAGLSGYTLEEYGTLICWKTDVISGDDFSLDMSCARHNYAYLKGKADPVFAKQDGKMLYTNVLVGFSLEDCAKDLILRPYIKLKDMTTGETVTLYGGSVCRSIGYIAKQNADTYKPGSSGYKYVHKIIDAVYGQEP